MSEPVKLNIGCGGKLWPGFVNIDAPSNWSGAKPDVEADIRDLPFPDGYADEAHAYHVIEHFQRWETEAVLAEWVRVLKPGGTLVLECPCLDKVLGLFFEFARRGEPLNPRLTLWALYGDPGYMDVAMTHKWCFGARELAALMERAGLVDVRACEPQTHIAARDMRLEGIKRAD